MGSRMKIWRSSIKFWGSPQKICQSQRKSDLFLDLVGGGAWPFLAGGVICLVNSDNERDSMVFNEFILVSNENWGVSRDNLRVSKEKLEL